MSEAKSLDAMRAKFENEISLGLDNMHGLTILLDDIVTYHNGECIAEDGTASIALTAAMRQFAQSLKDQFDDGVQMLDRLAKEAEGK